MSLNNSTVHMLDSNLHRRLIAQSLALLLSADGKFVGINTMLGGLGLKTATPVDPTFYYIQLSSFGVIVEIYHNNNYVYSFKCNGDSDINLTRIKYEADG